MTQHSRHAPLVPLDPPPSMNEREQIVAYIEEGGELMIGYERLVQQGVDYQIALLPRLARVPVVEVSIYHSVYVDKVSP